MPEFTFGETLPIDKGGLFIVLKSKGDKVHCRFVKSGYYNGKHFVPQNGKTVMSYCPRVMNQQECQYCEKYFELKAKEKESKSEDEKKELRNQARDFKSSVRFYYPIIDRETEKAKIFVAALSVRTKLESDYRNGIDILKYDYVITRTEELGSGNYYHPSRIDSSETKPFTDQEKEEYEKAKGWDIEKMVNGPVKQSDQKMEQEEVDYGKNADEIPPNEEETVNDIPF